MFGRGRLSEAGIAALFLLLCGMPAASQDDFDLHANITGHVYHDKEISVRTPADWSLAIDTYENGGHPLTKGAILRKGRYILRLCTGCGQTSGVMGGRFSEILDLVQPWSRPLGGPYLPCGVLAKSKASKLLDRVDLWYRRDPAHPSDPDSEDCREPRTTATVWYGSYFAENCSRVRDGNYCEGFFLYPDRLAGKRAGNSKGLFYEMAIGMTYETTDLDQLPHKDDPELNQMLHEATAIVESIRYRRN
jgi:hypothetical protein